MTYQTEFPDFPAADLPAIPAHWQDQSWHNDACPSWQGPKGLRVYVDFADPALREGGEHSPHRFTVVDDEGDWVGLHTDDWAAVVAVMEGAA